MPNSCHQALDFDRILALLCPLSEAGKHLMRKALSAKTLPERQIEQDYARISKLMTKFQIARLERIGDHLSHFLLIHTQNLHKEVDLQLHEIFELKQFIYFYQKLRSIYLEHDLPCQHPLPDLSSLFEYLDPDGHKTPSFRLSPAYSLRLKTALDQISGLSLSLKHQEQQRLQDAKTALNRPGLQSEIVVSRLQTEQIRQLEASGFYHIASENVANITFKLMDTAAQKSLRAQISKLRTRIASIEVTVLETINKRIRKFTSRIEGAQNAVASIDWDYTRAVFGTQHKCSIPKISKSPRIVLQAVRNLHLEEHLQGTGRKLQAIDLELEQPVNVLIGPNMGGKTTALKTLGQFALMLRLGIPLPCKKAALPLYDFVWYNHDTHQHSEDLSSFGRETISFMKAIQQPGRGLMLLDEFAKGTNPAEGEALATSTLLYLQKTVHTTLAATHYSAPALLGDLGRYSIKGIDEQVFKELKTDLNTGLTKRLKLLSEAMDYRIIRLRDKELPPMCALQIAGILGLEESILEDSARLINETGRSFSPKRNGL